MTNHTAAIKIDPHAVRERLRNAYVYLCTDARVAQGDLVEFVTDAVRGGVDIVQLRDKKLEAAAERAALDVVREICHAHGALLSVNDRADLALLVGADIFHTGQGDLSVADSRRLLGPDVILGRSTNTLERALVASEDPGVDYFCVGPVWETPTKPGRAAVGPGLLSRVAETHPDKPWFAIGNVNLDSVGQVIDAGATRVVVVRALTESSHVLNSARELKRIMTEEGAKYPENGGRVAGEARDGR
ncbi:thiamine phosphate synthase [Lysinibacter sp. HNR]|uniref:thiamine phosphate synthase n=1 Tax=Lysinibacter sp. HNR TaxID=3031408 RepID=UPI00243572B1|nr:thiamine phosphate synthase [Lysinibacter sp. HNR]WGD36447.1 thiamine phosphate synthase [Lysinibacter sp. HNR]